MSFKDLALPLAAKNIPVIRLYPGEKRPIDSAWQMIATTDTNKILAWDAETPNAGCGAVAKNDGVLFFESDAEGTIERYEREMGETLDETLVVQSRPGRLHYYFVQTPESRACGNISQKLIPFGSLRQNNAYLVAPGSIHPITKQPYELVNDAEPIPIPAKLIEWLQNQIVKAPSSAASLEQGARIPNGQHDSTLAFRAGQLRHANVPFDTAIEILTAEVEQFYDGYGADYCDMVQKCVKSIYKKPAGPSQPDCFVSSSLPSAADDYEEPGLRTTRVSDVAAKRVRWLWPGFLALGKLNLFCGNPDHGKSLASIDVVARATTGTPWPSGTNDLEPIEVLIVAGEDDLNDTIKPRLLAAKADDSKVHYLESVLTEPDKNAKQYIRQLRLDEDIAAMEKLLLANPAIRLLVIDPVSSYLGNAKMVDEQAVRNVLNPLKRLAEKLNICILTIMHLNKKVDLDAVNRVGGAMAFVGIPRLAWIFAKKPKEELEESEEKNETDNTIFMMKLKANILKSGSGGLTFVTEAVKMKIEEGEDFIPYVRWTGTTQKTLEELAATKKSKKKENHFGNKLKQTEDWLLEYLSDRTPKPAKGTGGIFDTADQMFGASMATVKRASLSLGVVKQPVVVEKNGKTETVWMWSLKPDETVEVADEVLPPPLQEVQAPETLF
jgi:RecA-family ATPase